MKIVSKIHIVQILGAISLLAIASISFAQTPKQDDVRELLSNQIIEGEMTGAQTHRYKFDLKANEFFQVRVEQKGVDVALNLSDGKGNVLAAMDSPNGKEGFETLTFVSNGNTGFILEVISPNEKAEKGIYIISRVASRTATEKDKRRVEVEKIFVEGIKARDTEGQSETGIAKLEESLKGWQELEDIYLSELTEKSLKELKENKYFATFNNLFQELNKISNLQDEASTLALKSKDGSFVAREKLNESLILIRAFKVKIYDATFVEKIIEASKESKRPLYLLRSLQYYTKSGENHCLDSIGQTYYNLSQWKEYIDYKKLSVAGWQEVLADKTFATVIKPQNLIQIKLLLGIGLSQIGSALNSYFGKSEEAINYLNQSLEYIRVLYQETQDLQAKIWEAGILRQIAFIYSKESRNIAKTIEFFTKSLEIYRTIPEKKQSEADTLLVIALQYMGSFQYKLAKEKFEESLKIYGEVDYKHGQVQVLQMLGVMYGVLNNKAEVSRYMNRSLQILQAPDFAENYRKNFAKTNGSSQGFEVYEELNDSFIEYSRLGCIGLAYRWLEDYPKSLEYYQKTLEASRARKESRDISTSLFDVGYTLGKLERWDEATRYYIEELEVSRDLGNKEDIAKSLQDVGGALLQAKKPQEALKYLNESLLNYQLVEVDENKSFSPSYSAVQIYISRSYYDLGNKRLAIFYGKRAVNAIQSERQRLQNLDLISQKGFLEGKEKHYRRLADWLIEEGKFAQAEQVLRMLKEEEYSGFVLRDADEIKTLNQRIELDDVEKKVIEKYTLLADKVSEIGQEFYKLEEKDKQLREKGLKLSAEDEARFKKLGEELEIARGAFKLFLDKELVKEIGKDRKEKIEKQNSDRQLLGDLGKGAVTLYTVVGADRYRVILTTPTGQVDGKFEIKAEDLNKKVFAFREALKNPNIDPRPLGKELYDILLKPIEKNLKAAGAKTLLWFLDGTLRYIPLAALSPDGKRYLIEDFQSVVLTSKSNNLESQNSGKTLKVLGLGVSTAQTVNNPLDPNSKITFPALTGTKQELLTIVADENSITEKGILSGRRFLDETFTTENFQDSLRSRKFNVVHIASHFYLGSKNATSFLLLGNGKILSLSDISGSSFIKFGGVDLVTLSACKTAFAENSNGAEVDTFADVIQSQGGKSVLATLWSVEDESTSVLMSEFYRLLKENPKLTKAEAMQFAQKAMFEGKLQPLTEDGRKRAELLAGFVDENTNTIKFEFDKNKPFAHPFYWSPFILIGNWR